jgi:hypothetical protein
MNSSIKDFVVVAGTAGFTDIKTGEVHDVTEMLTTLGFTVDELAQVRLTSRLVRPLFASDPHPLRLGRLIVLMSVGHRR